MKHLITTTALLGLCTANVFSSSLVSKANAADIDSRIDSVLLDNSLEEQQTMQYADCYYDTYGNLHCWHY
ncbi:MAG: hypothetical protein AAGB01_09310 [Cyanobacteria bacterium P01_F01_bin.42]